MIVSTIIKQSNEMAVVGEDAQHEGLRSILLILI